MFLNGPISKFRSSNHLIYCQYLRHSNNFHQKNRHSCQKQWGKRSLNSEIVSCQFGTFKLAMKYRVRTKNIIYLADTWLILQYFCWLAFSFFNSSIGLQEYHGVTKWCCLKTKPNKLWNKMLNVNDIHKLLLIQCSSLVLQTGAQLSAI